MYQTLRRRLLSTFLLSAYRGKTSCSAFFPQASLSRRGRGARAVLPPSFFKADLWREPIRIHHCTRPWKRTAKPCARFLNVQAWGVSSRISPTIPCRGLVFLTCVCKFFRPPPLQLWHFPALFLSHHGDVQADGALITTCERQLAAPHARAPHPVGG